MLEIAGLWYIENKLVVPIGKIEIVKMCFHFGTYISLMLYLTAISKGKLSVVPAVTITGPMFAEIFEIFRTRKLPNIYVVISFILFICGFYTFTLLGSQ
jgi:hypothetical protein